MKKICKIENLDCANCALKMEESIKKVDGVLSAQVNFFAQKLTLELDDGKVDEAMLKIAKICKRVEPDCKLVL